MRKTTLSISLFICLLAAGCANTGPLISARNALNAGQLETAFLHYQEVLLKSPAHVEARNQIQVIGTQLSNQAADAAHALVPELKSAPVPQLELALAKLAAAQKYDLQNTILPPLKTELQNQIASVRAQNEALAGQIRSFLTEKKFSEVPALIDSIRASDPSSPAAAELDTEYRNQYGSYLEGEIKRLLDEGKVSDARDQFRLMKELGLPSERIAGVESEFRARELTILKEQIQAHLKAKQYYSAFLKMAESGRQDEMKQFWDEAKEKGSQFYLDQAKKRFAAGEFSRSYLEAVKGFELDEKRSGMFEIHRDGRDKVMEAMQKYIAIPAFGAPQASPDLGPQFSDALISYLFRILPYGINIVEREKIDMLMAEKERGLEEVGNVLNVNLIVSGNVSLLNIDRQKSESKATVRAEVGQTMQANPQYEMLLRASNGKVNQRDLPPAMISVPQFENFQYTKGVITVKGFANVSARIFDTKKGGIVYAQEFNANYEQSDEYQDAVDMAGVKGDSIELPSDTEVSEKLRAKIIQQIAAVIQEQFDKREKAFLEDAEYFIARKEVEKAMDPLAQGFLYSIKGKVEPADSHFKALRDLILAYTEKDFD